MGLFSGLEGLGFKDENREIFTEPENKDRVKEAVKKEKKVPELTEEDVLFPKTYKCPICDNTFKSLAVRAGKVRSELQDDDLRPRYSIVDPLKYDAIVCPTCGYSAISRYFDYVMPVQNKRLRGEVMSKFRGIELSTDKFSYEEALIHYKMVLMCDVVGGVSNSRKAYTCLKMAWVIRGWLESEGSKLPPEQKKELIHNHRDCLQNALDGYMKAFSTETFPLSGMDEVTLTYLVAQLAYELGDYNTSIQMLSKLLGRKNVPGRIKNKAVELKDNIRDKVAK